ncbi:unnamed protein product [Bursaphelenchus okinawaensis]|uniref:Uncharacterized protein n=1 Tax=Bursaphelenchus okinawaensis TaxID=465554 RepID=A0A811LDU1_9BILA|nr:unnamed protein product [Bursaphelenchus okinawaensis]CAG9121244.1 unnamed protein product [Bursaphelenchus okinawaensis]
MWRMDSDDEKPDGYMEMGFPEDMFENDLYSYQALSKAGDLFVKALDSFSKLEDTFAKPNDLYARPQDSFLMIGDNFSKPEDSLSKLGASQSTASSPRQSSSDNVNLNKSVNLNEPSLPDSIFDSKTSTSKLDATINNFDNSDTKVLKPEIKIGKYPQDTTVFKLNPIKRPVAQKWVTDRHGRAYVEKLKSRMAAAQMRPKPVERPKSPTPEERLKGMPSHIKLPKGAKPFCLLENVTEEYLRRKFPISMDVATLFRRV